jgi:hypothetical protein
VQEAFKSLDPDKKIRAHLARSAIEMKIFKYITEQCKVTKKETSLNDLRANIDGLVTELIMGKKPEPVTEEPATVTDTPVNAVESSRGEKATNSDQAKNLSETNSKAKSAKPVTNNQEGNNSASNKRKASAQGQEEMSNAKKPKSAKPVTNDQKAGKDSSKNQPK